MNISDHISKFDSYDVKSHSDLSMMQTCGRHGCGVFLMINIHALRVALVMLLRLIF